MQKWSAPWRCQAFHLEHIDMILRDTVSLKEWVNLWSQEKRLGPNSMSITMLQDDLMKETLMDLRLMRVGAAAVINRHFQNGETTCRQLSKRLPNNSTIFAAEPMAITLALDYYRYMDPVKHDVVVYSDSMYCLQAVEGEDNENPLIYNIMNLLWALSDTGTCVRFCWVPNHCSIEGNEIVDQLAKDTLDHDINPLATVHYADLKHVVNSYIQHEVQIKWDVSIHGRDLYLLKPTLGPPKKSKHLTGAEEVVITRLRIGHTKATKSHILSRGPPTACQHCGQNLTIEHMLLQRTVLQHICDEYYMADSLKTLFETIPETCIVEFLREAVFLYLIWKAIYPIQHIIRITHQLTKFAIYVNHHILTPLDSCNMFIEHKQLRKPYLWKTANMSLRTCVSLNKCNPKTRIVYILQQIYPMHCDDELNINQKPLLCQSRTKVLCNYLIVYPKTAVGETSSLFILLNVEFYHIYISPV